VGLIELDFIIHVHALRRADVVYVVGEI